MAFLTFTDGGVPTASQLNAGVRDQVITQCTAATRPGSPVEGQFIYETDTDRTYYYSGAAWVILTEPRQTWSPTITQSGSVAGTVNRGWYRRQNGLFEARLKWTSSAAGTAANAVTVSTPVTLLDSTDLGGGATVYDASTGVLHHAYVFPSSTTVAVMVVSGNTGNFGVAPAITLASGDQIFMTMFGTY